MMTYIDMETYPRRSHFEYFNSLAFPYCGMCANADVSNLIRYTKERGASGFLGCLWVAATALNDIPEFRQRIIGGRIAEFDHCDTSHTVALPDHTFSECRTDCRMPLDDFLAYGRQRQQEAMTHHGFVEEETDETDLIFVSCTPWVSFTQTVLPVPIPADSNPRITFGKYIKDGERTLMPLSIQCNHALADAWHIGQFYQKFQEITDNF